jgi:hypothetical protein
MTFNIIRVWWRMGEENAAAVYRRGFWTLFMLFILTCLVLSLFSAFLPRKLTGFIVGLAVWLFFRIVAEGRRAIIFSPDSIKCRPPFGPPRTTRISDISRIDEATMMVTFNGCVHFTGGVKLVLKDGDTLGIPLDFPDRKEILKRIKLAVSTVS